MDSLDTKIVQELRKNARTPFLQIAKKLDVSEGTVRKRVGKLVEGGVIKRFTLELANENNAIIEISTNPNIATEKISAEIKGIGIDRIFEVAGRFEILCFVKAKSLQETNEIVEKIRAIKGVTHTETFPVLREG